LRSVDHQAQKVAPVSVQPKQSVEAAVGSNLDRGVSKRVDIISKRLSLLETRMNGQEENLHRVLTMLVDWVESDIRSKESYVNAGRAA
jgi:hypothetical protein